MKTLSTTTRRRLGLAGIVLALGASAAVSAYAQSASPARQAVEARKAAFTLIGANCRTLADVVKGNKPFDAKDVQKRATRIAVLSDVLNEVFPEGSNLGEPDSKTKPEAWTNQADFNKRIKEFQDHSAELVKVAAVEKDTSEAFKTAFGAVAQDCKSCHDTYRVK